MTENVYTYLVDLPPGVNEMVTPCSDGYTVYLNSRASDRQRRKAYYHAVIRHITRNDFEKTDVQEIEYEAHKED